MRSDFFARIYHLAQGRHRRPSHHAGDGAPDGHMFELGACFRGLLRIIVHLALGLGELLAVVGLEGLDRLLALLGQHVAAASASASWPFCVASAVSWICRVSCASITADLVPDCVACKVERMVTRSCKVADQDLLRGNRLGRALLLGPFLLELRFEALDAHRQPTEVAEQNELLAGAFGGRYRSPVIDLGLVC